MEQKFDYNNLPVRIITDEEDQTWFAGIDICEILGYTNPDTALRKLDEDVRKLTLLRVGSGQARKTWTVNEFGLYSLILTSTKPEAKAFQRWVTHEVLPAIRKAGKYTSEQEREFESNLRSLANEIQILKQKKDQLQTQINDTKHDIDIKTGEMIALIRSDRNQLKLPFPKEV